MKKVIKLFARLALGAGFLSAVADRFGYWGENAVWGNWQNFVDYTALINPWFPENMINPLAVGATALEVILAIGLILGIRTKWMARISGILLLIFGLSMAFSIGIKAPLDYSVFAAAAAAFLLGEMNFKFLELDEIF